MSSHRSIDILTSQHYKRRRFLDVLKNWDWQTKEAIRRAKKDNFMPFCNATLKKLRLSESEKKELRRYLIEEATYFWFNGKKFRREESLIKSNLEKLKKLGLEHKYIQST